MSVDPTSLAAFATEQSHSQLKQSVAIKVARTAMDAAKAEGQAAISLLQAAAEVAQRSVEPGKGGALDVTG